MMFFKERAELADKAEKWIKENNVANCALSVVSYLAAMDLLRSKYDRPQMPDACCGCSNHPSNGGSGVCHCTLGSPIVWS